MVKRKGVVAAGPSFKRAKGKAIQASEKSKREPDPQEEVEDAEQEVPAEEEMCPEDKLAQLEEQTVASRKKELKALGAPEIKDLVLKKGLDAGKKEDMIQAIVKAEADERAEQRAHQDRIRAVLVRKKEELEGHPAGHLKELCAAQGITGSLAKPARIEKLLQLWQQEGGVDRALVQEARAKREAELSTLDKEALQKLCQKSGVNPFVTEVMVERLLRHEKKEGRFARPLEEDVKETGKAARGTGDLVEALLNSEANRKKEEEAKKLQEEAAANKRKELRAKPMDELKKALSAQGLEASGKKEEMVEKLLQAHLQEEKLAARKAELKAMAKDELKKYAVSRKLEASSKEATVEAILAWEAQRRAAKADFESKVLQVLAKKKEELEAKTGPELKEMCASRGLKAGSSKEDRVDRLFQAARNEGDIDQVVQEMCIAERRGELMALDQSQLQKLCAQSSVDPFVKEVLVERLVEHGRP